VAEIEAAGGRAQAVPTDAVDAGSRAAAGDRAEERYGRIDTWVNAAAVSVWGKVEDITSEEFDRVLRVNVLGHVHGAQAALPALRRAGGGVIVGISSVEGVRAVPLHAPYTASKMALRGFYDCLRMELAAERSTVAVTTILPASIDTPFFEHARSKLGGHLPKPPPPVYSADVVAAAIVRAARRPTREVPVGGSAIGFFLGPAAQPGADRRRDVPAGRAAGGARVGPPGRRPGQPRRPDAGHRPGRRGVPAGPGAAEQRLHRAARVRPATG
jgi:NAD(P)-dependent dehydrogenase (short-subunit alcohol dehydrogenase family)